MFSEFSPVRHFVHSNIPSTSSACYRLVGFGKVGRDLSLFGLVFCAAAVSTFAFWWVLCEGLRGCDAGVVVLEWAGLVVWTFPLAQ